VTAAASGIATFDDLVQRCQDWLFGRSDLAGQVPTFIQLFEAKANRKLFCRQMEQRAFAILDITLPEPEFIDLPVGFQTMRRVRVINATGSAQKPRLRFATGAQMDDLRMNHQHPGSPVWFALFNSEMEICPVPDQSYRIEMIYRSYLPPLGPAAPAAAITPPPLYIPPGLSPVPTNWLLQTAPDAYLYGTLMEAAPYLHDDDRITVWAQGVQAAFDGLNDLSDQALFNAGPLVMRRKGSSYS
jgi:hypothetical protein